MVTIEFFSTTDCTGPSFSPTFKVGACLSNEGFYSKFQSISAVLSSSPTLSVTSSPTTSSSPTVSVTSSPTALPLTGYYVRANYNDAACQSILFSESFRLNSCNRNDDKTYTIYTATASTESETRYTDSSCSKVLTPTITTSLSLSGACDGKERKTVSVSGVPESSTSMGSLRCVRNYHIRTSDKYNLIKLKRQHIAQ